MLFQKNAGYNNPASISMYWAWMLGEMAGLGPEMGETPDTVARWRAIEKTLRGNTDRFWSEADGIYFAGLPDVGNSHRNKVVETNPIALASHPRFGFYNPERFQRMMAYAPKSPGGSASSDMTSRRAKARAVPTGPDR